jgi:hypothetical protein
MQDVHRQLSGQCFNQCWDFIDKPERTEEDTERMRLLAYASLWHWTQREDCAPMNLSVGEWQVARVEALAGNGAVARAAGRRCLGLGQDHGLEPFYVGYAYEALARADLVLGDRAAATGHLASACEALSAVTDAESARMLAADLDALQTALNA